MFLKSLGFVQAFCLDFGLKCDSVILFNKQKGGCFKTNRIERIWKSILNFL